MTLIITACFYLIGFCFVARLPWPCLLIFEGRKTKKMNVSGDLDASQLRTATVTINFMKKTKLYFVILFIYR